MFLIHTSPSHADLIAAAIVGACREEGWPSPVQPKLLHTLFNDLLGRNLDFEKLPPATIDEVEVALASPEERQELIQLMCAVEILCDSVPQKMEASVAEWARRLQVPERALVFLRDLARGEARKTLEDFYRLNWIGDLSRRRAGFETQLERLGAEAFALTVEADPAELQKWRALEACPEGSIGRHLHEFYEKRGFKRPGEKGAASAAVAHHDWIHLLADYGTTPLGEIEVVAFQAACSRTPGAFCGFVGALGLFESGAFAEGFVTGLHLHQGLSRDGGPERLAEAIARAKACNTDLMLDVDYFSMSHEPLDDLKARFGIPPKSARTQELDPWGALHIEPKS